MIDYLARITLLQSSIETHQLFLISRPADIQYFTGFVCLNSEEREAFLVISNMSATLLYPSFSPVHKMDRVQYHPGYWPSDLEQVIQKYTGAGLTDVLIDKASLFVNEFEAVQQAKLTICEQDREKIWRQRMAKDETEIAYLEKAGYITSKIMERAIRQLSPGITELEIAQFIEVEVRNQGADGTSFPSVVAFGAHSALPHHQPTATELNPETPVLIDMGAKFNGYCGDMTRTMWFGKKPSQKFLKIEKIIKKAYKAAINEVTVEISGANVDKAARDIIAAAGYGPTFIHTTGHGVGLEIHEQPSLYFKKEVTLPIGAVITVEPGIYLEGEFGYRHENMVLVEKEGGKELSK